MIATTTGLSTLQRALRIFSNKYLYWNHLHVYEGINLRTFVLLARHSVVHNNYLHIYNSPPNNTSNLYSNIRYKGTVIESKQERKKDSNDIFSRFYEDDEVLPQTYRDLQLTVPSVRLDSVLSAGLNMSRSELEENFYESRLRINNQRALKKGKQVKEGDALDLIMSADDESLKLKRVRLIHIADDKTKKGRFKVYVRVWRGIFDIKTT